MTQPIRRDRWEAEKNLFHNRSNAAVAVNLIVPKPHRPDFVQTCYYLYVVVNEILERNKHWRAVGTDVSFFINAGNGLEYAVIHSVNLLCDDEVLGKVSIKKNRNQMVFGIEKAKPFPGLVYGEEYQIKHTGKLDMAVKLIRRLFYPAPVTQSLEIGTTRAKSLLDTDLFQKRNAERKTFDGIWGEERAFAMRNRELYLNQFPAKRADLERYRVAADECEIVKKIHDQVDMDKFMLVMLKGGEYIVRLDAFNIVSYTHDTLPAPIREKLGLLKLLEPGQMASDVGARIEERTFLIVTGEKEQ